MRRIQSKKHKIGTYEIDKISLSCFDDKRFILDDGIHTLAYFRKDIDSYKNNNNNKKNVKKSPHKRKRDSHKMKRFSQTKGFS